MDNYICINGKKAELTEEQMKALGIELPKPNPFERVVNHTTNDFYHYYFITSMGQVNEAIDHGFQNGIGNDDLRFRAGNYCTDEALLKQRALHETLNRLLWRYSMEHKDKNTDDHLKIYVYYNYANQKWQISCTYRNTRMPGELWFDTKEIAENAIKEIIEPFMKAHPNFKF